MADIERLRAIIKERGFTEQELAKSIGLSRHTLYRRFNTEGGTFALEEVQRLIEVLRLSHKEVYQIFNL